ncbi:hypothetical protein BKA67DRAFT_671955 [Truncatella angustata]|uniref:Lytic polysaccharide monooxygenase n=1 Tax=Truncatella angustata TaxID=152316 RepID=A0A9P8UPZ7_9PEZI|nr:uncharacterized protein BKA67DRAFT_671955 [Truncatella angustata]KAH6656219.1 hypothetical protein BKA67DRAFT_671955 [Truncatella angustata]
MHSTMPSILLLAFTAMLITSTDAHVVLENPRPFKPAEDGPSNPVTQATFPCKAPAGTRLQIDGAPTEMAIGDDQLLTFQGKAVHGGGSCQISLTSDIDHEFQPRKDARFFVIHSIESGCPARNQAGNLEGPNTDKYYFRIPAGVDPGKYVLSWSWVPRIGGGPEFYQNCAPIIVSPATTTQRQTLSERREVSLAKRKDFPDLFMADLGDLTGGCTHTEGLKAQLPIAYPNPGESVEIGNPGQELIPQSCDGNPRLRDGSGSESSTAASASTTAPLATSVSSTTTASLSGQSTSSLELVDSMTTSLNSMSAPSVSSQMMSTPPIFTSQGSTTSAVTSAPVSCQEGHLLCVDGDKFSTCTGGQWTTPQPLAPGTHCMGGAGVGLNIINPYS